MPDISLYGADEMSSERRKFMAWYDEQKDREFDNTRFGGLLPR